jgi:hypothetical protein
MWIVTLIGLLLMISYFFPGGIIGDTASGLKSGATLIAAFVLVYSGIQAIRNNLMNVIRRVDNETTKWYWEAYALAVIVLYIVAALIDPKLNQGAIPSFLYGKMAVVGFGALFSSLAFWNMAALLNIIKARTYPVAALIIIMTIGLLANSPVVVSYIPALVPLNSWFADIPGAAGSRGILMGIGIGAIALSVRLLLQTERGWMGER